jgi:hypothetical protein
MTAIGKHGTASKDGHALEIAFLASMVGYGVLLFREAKAYGFVFGVADRHVEICINNTGNAI